MSRTAELSEWRRSLNDARQRFRALGTDTPTGRMLAQVLLVPVLLAAFGPGQFGTWVQLSALVGVLALAELVLPRGELARLPQQEFQSTWLASLALSGVGLLLTLAIAALLPHAYWLRGTGSGALPLQICVLSLGLVHALRAPGALLRVARASTPDGTLERRLRASAWPIALLGSAVVAALGGGPAGVALIQLAPVATLVVLDARAAWSFGFAFALPRSRDEVHAPLALLHARAPELALAAAQALARDGLLLMVGAFAGLERTALFAVLRGLASPVRQVVLSLARAVRPESVLGHTGTNRTALREQHELAVKGLTIVAIACAVFVFFAGPLALRVVSLGKLGFDGWIFAALLAAHVAATPWRVGVELVLFDRPLYVARWLAFAAVPGIALGAPLCGLLGPAAGVLGLAAAELALAATPLFHEARRRTGARPFAPLTESVLATAVLFVAGLTAGWIGLAFVPPLAPVTGALGAAAVLLGAWKGWLDPREQAQVASTLRRHLRQRARDRGRAERQEERRRAA